MRLLTLVLSVAMLWTTVAAASQEKRVRGEPLPVVPGHKPGILDQLPASRLHTHYNFRGLKAFQVRLLMDLWQSSRTNFVRPLFTLSSQIMLALNSMLRSDESVGDCKYILTGG